MLGKSRRHISSLHNLFTLYSFLCIQRDWYIMLIAFMYLDTQHFITKIQLSFGVKLVLIMNISSSFTSRWFQLLFPVRHLSVWLQSMSETTLKLLKNNTDETSCLYWTCYLNEILILEKEIRGDGGGWEGESAKIKEDEMLNEDEQRSSCVIVRGNTVPPSDYLKSLYGYAAIVCS